MKESLQRKLSAHDINALEIRAYEGRLEIVRSQKHMLSAVRKLKKERLLGFDTETRPAFEKGVSYPPSLVQLASSNYVYIFHLQFLETPAKLFSLLANAKIVKAGVSVSDDVKDLRSVSEFVPAGFVDIGDCARKCGMQHHGLRGLTAVLLGFRISKSKRRYNWSVPSLSRSAIRYAATDAWVGRELYLTMQHHGCLDA